MGKLIKFLYVKWVLGHCPHFCAFCKYRKEMFSYCTYDILRSKER